MREALDNDRSGYLIGSEDAKAFGARLRERLMDEEKRREMGRIGRKYSEKFGLAKLAARRESSFVKALLSGRGK